MRFLQQPKNQMQSGKKQFYLLLVLLFFLCVYFIQRPSTIQTTKLNLLVELVEKKFPDLAAQQQKELATLFLRLCYQYDFSPSFILGLIHEESNFRTDSRSPAGALGLMQLLPNTAKPIAEALGIQWSGENTLLDPMKNLQIGFFYLSYLRAKFKGSAYKYVTAYNWGPSRVGNYLSQQQMLPLDYYRKIYRRKKDYKFYNMNYFQ